MRNARNGFVVQALTAMLRTCLGGDAVADRGFGTGQDLHDEDQPADAQRSEPRLRQELCGGAGEGFRRPHQAADFSAQSAGLHSAADRRHAIRLDPMRDPAAGILRRRRQSLRSDGGAGSGRFACARPARRRRSGGPEADAQSWRQQGPARRRHVHECAVLGDCENADPASGGFQGQEDPRARLAVSDGADRQARRNAGGDDARRRRAGDAAGHHRRRGRRHRGLDADALQRCGEIRDRDRPAGGLRHGRGQQGLVRVLAAGSAEDRRR